MNRSRKFAEERVHALDYPSFICVEKEKKKKGERQDDEYSLGRRRIVYNCVYLSSVIYLAYIFPIRFKRTGGQICFDDGDKSGNGVE